MRDIFTRLVCCIVCVFICDGVTFMLVLRRESYLVALYL